MSHCGWGPLYSKYIPQLRTWKSNHFIGCLYISPIASGGRTTLNTFPNLGRDLWSNSVKKYENNNDQCVTK